MLSVRATLTVAGNRTLGWLTNEHPDSIGEVVLLLDAYLGARIGHDVPKDRPPIKKLRAAPRPSAGHRATAAAGPDGAGGAWVG